MVIKNREKTDSIEYIYRSFSRPERSGVAYCHIVIYIIQWY